MNKIFKTLCSVAMSMIVLTSGATELGYSNGNCGQDNIFRLGATEKQGLAIKLTKEKLASLVGRKISGMSVAFGTRNTTNNKANLFIASSLDGAPLAEQDVTIVRTESVYKWGKFSFDNPYVITGEEECLYIGYTAEAKNTLNVYTGDFSSDIKDCSFAYNNGSWTDIYGLGFGAANIRAIIDDVPDFTDAILKTFPFDGYFKAGDPYSLGVQLFNFGTENITSFDVEVKVGDKAPVKQSYVGQNVAQWQLLDIDLPSFNSEVEGNVPVEVAVVNVNGKNDIDVSDNVSVGNMFFYPSAMERSMLLEGFTGQACSNCPRGHQIINAFLNGQLSSPVVEVMHHSGYAIDYYTMDSDLDYTMFYGEGSTYAPACMFNRTQFPQIGNVPVMEVNSAYLEYCYNLLEATQPYVSLKLESEYNAETREVKVRFKSLNHNALPAKENLMNVMLVQDNLVGAQTGMGSAYIHNAVFRGTLFDKNSWGMLLASNEAGGVTEWEKTFVLPEVINSDAKAENTDPRYAIEVVPEDMRIVAYVGAWGGEYLNGHQIYNCVEVKLGESYEQKGLSTGIKFVNDNKPNVYIRVENGCIVVDGDYDNLSLCDISGKHVACDSQLPKGIYIVRVYSHGNAIVKKVLVR